VTTPIPKELFERERKRLISLAYGILGSFSEAEDVVQEAYLRPQSSEEQLRNPEAWLTTVVSRIAIDRLRSAQRRREVYPGPWLPEPILQAPQEQAAITRSRLSIAFLYLLEKLEPEQRAAFVLREVFDCAYREIASLLGKSEAACRQIVRRARGVFAKEDERVNSTRHVPSELVSRFINALAAADEQTLLHLLADDATLTTDGGGKARAALNVIYGAERVVKFFLGVRKKNGASYTLAQACINGEPGLLVWVGGKLAGAVAFAANNDFISAIYSISNPEKLVSYGRGVIRAHPVATNDTRFWLRASDLAIPANLR
jgi:RNA polymerase sigma-70 factor, ECF subfamily